MATHPEDSARSHLVITGRRRAYLHDLREIWTYRALLWMLVVRDVKVRYKQTVLGASWAVLQPLLSTAIFAVIFGRFARMPSDGYPYPVFVFTALIPWTFFAGAVTASANSLVASAHLVTKVYFPRLIVPLASILAGLLDLALAVALLFPLSWFYGISWNPRLLATPALVADLVLVAVAIGAPLAALTVSYRDFRHAVPFLVQVWMYVTPIVYPSSLFPERWRWVLRLNPMSGVVEGFRSAFLGRAFDIPALAVSLLVTLCLLLAGFAYFERVQRRFADVI